MAKIQSPMQRCNAVLRAFGARVTAQMEAEKAISPEILAAIRRAMAQPKAP